VPFNCINTWTLRHPVLFSLACPVTDRLQDKNRRGKPEWASHAEGFRQQWIVKLLELPNETFFHPKNRVFIKVWTIWGENVGNYRLVAWRLDNEVYVGCTVRMPAQFRQELTDRGFTVWNQ
jgi:hypothetical protein